MRKAQDLWVCQLGRIPYREGLALQELVARARREELVPDTLLLLEHPPVITRGRRSDEGEVTMPASFYRSRGVELVDVDRGGRLTYHGPGQLVGYPIMRVPDIRAHLAGMESALIEALAEEGIAARSRREEGSDYTGVWVQDRKIASIGLHIARRVSTHGFALNVANDMEPFSWFVPCGLPAVRMTSVREESATGEADMRCMRRRVAMRFCRAHGRRQRLVSCERLLAATALPERVAVSA